MDPVFDHLKNKLDTTYCIGCDFENRLRLLFLVGVVVFLKEASNDVLGYCTCRPPRFDSFPEITKSTRVSFAPNEVLLVAVLDQIAKRSFAKTHRLP
jgi:hypothetical protein